MELEWETRPLSIVHHPREWHDAGPGTSSSPVPPSSFTSTSSISQRRRSSAVHMPPAAPPPNQPIPNVPVPPRISLGGRESLDSLDEGLPHPQSKSLGVFSNPFGRPSASAKLAAVAAFSQARHASTSNNRSRSPITATSSIENLSDPPPRSILQGASSRALTQHQEIVPDRLLLSPPETRQSESRPSSRRALTRALELAREAVQLDATNDDPHAAVIAYGRSVALLSEVMERVRRGEDSTETHRRRNGRRRSVVAQEEEVRRLKAIHDTYADRMNILSVIYSIPPIPHSPSSVYTSTMSVSTDSTQPSSPTTSSSPTSESSDHFPPTTLDRPGYIPNGHRLNGDARQEDSEMLSSSKLDIETSGSSGPTPVTRTRAPSSPQPPSSYHPYAAAPRHSADSALPIVATNQPPGAPVLTRTRSGSIVGRSRASSALPPPAPPPLNSPPPAPTQAPTSLELPSEVPSTQVLTTTYLDVVGRPRGNSTGHKRTGSGSKLGALQEEAEKQDNRTLQEQQGYHFEYEADFQPRVISPDASRNPDRDSHPLPPLPSPSSSGSSLPDTPRNAVEKPPPSPLSAHFLPRPRGGSTLSVRSELGPPPTLQHLINTSTMMGTISQRRSKMSAPPGSSSPPMESAPPSSMRLTGSSLPANTATSLGIGRSRASSQPGRRPSVVGGRISPMDNRPPLPQTAGLNGSNAPRKASFPSKLNPNIQPPQLVIQTELSPTGSIPSVPANSLVPPPPILSGNVPTTPTSPLPPMPPTDSLRKPYHMMNLLRTTMTTKSGGYVTRRLHVPQEVWSQGGAKLVNILEKVRVVEVLCSALEEVQNCSVEYFGAGNVSSGMALGIGSIGKKEGEAWIAKLEEFSSVCDGVVANFGKKLGVGEGFVLKKSSGVTTWGNKLTRQIDKFTNGKNLDSPAAYVAGLTRLFAHAQLLDEHTKALCSQPIAPSYAAFSEDIRTAAEVKLRRSSEFFASVVLTFVIRDLSQLLDKYAKKCEKWLAE